LCGPCARSQRNCDRAFLFDVVNKKAPAKSRKLEEGTMRLWPTIEDLAKDIGISVRTAYRWLKKKKILKKKIDGKAHYYLSTDSTYVTSDVMTGHDSNSNMSGIDLSDSFNVTGYDKSYLQNDFNVLNPSLTLVESPKEDLTKKSIQDKEKATERRRKWIEEWKDFAITWGIPWGESAPATVKFQIRDGVEEVLRRRFENEDYFSIRELVTETARSIFQQYRAEREIKKKAQKVKKEEEEARKKAELENEEKRRKEKRKDELIQSALAEVDSYIKAHELESLVDIIIKKDLEDQIRKHLEKSLTGEESIPPYTLTKQLLDTLLKETKNQAAWMKQQKAEEVEREHRKKMKQERVKRLIRIGLNHVSNFIRENQKELENVDYFERKEAEQYLKEELEDEVQGDESDQEVKELADEILEDFFFGDEDDASEDD
jgi:hypothetical protein